jgi:myo-inositol 2-dehydrogenase / D-chiro-inositol 1-dehydrogenase
MTLKLGVIGAGRIGKIHAENLARRIPETTVLAVADIDMMAARNLAESLSIPLATVNPSEVITLPDLDAVVICSATETHTPLIIEAARAGKHIFCEKPIDLDLQRIDEALAAVEQAGVKLQVGFNRRYDANFCQIRDVIQAGRIGEPHIVQITSRDPAPPPLDYVRASGGIFLDMTIHDFDMARFLVDSPVTEVYAAGSVLIDPAIGDADDFDTAVTTLRYASGAICVINNSRQAVYGYDQTVEVLGSKGSVRTANNTAHRAVVTDPEGEHGPIPLYFFLERYTDAYIAEMRDFVDTLIHDRMPSVSGADGRAPVVIGLAATKSAREGRPVKLSEIE